MIEHLLLGLFFFASMLNMGYWLFVFGKLLRFLPPEIVPPADLPVSILICARNEARNLEKNLPYFLDQDYPRFEVVVVDDGSTDETVQVLQDLQAKHRRLRVVPYQKPTGAIGKKWALQRGIAAARYSLLLLSDADCRPHSHRWIQGMAGVLKGEKTIGLGYGPHLEHPGWLNRFIRFDTVFTAIQYVSFAWIGRPYMGVGRNLIYHKKVFREAGGFEEHLELSSGDDDLLVNAVATSQNTALQLHPDTWVYSEPKHSWRDYLRQKQRHLSTATSYRFSDQAWLAGIAFSHLGHYLLGMGLLFAGHSTLVVVVYVVRQLLCGYLFSRLSRKFGASDLGLFFPILDLLYLGYYIVLAPAPFRKAGMEWR